ncbi:TolC family protein [Fulvivirga sp. RKSG066]|uniref:TolC family protein n=1 Tax=Fulvivirga aurantia TaxID=2529383 RepID=UPI0012BB4A03|nr:TolC family protein [Fulvivirga aurantia]MTI21568.1 TolC family protein [Fulvivirga aurantia]
MRKIIIGFFATVLCSASFGQEVSQLTFSEAVQIALKNNVNLKQQRNQLSASSMQKTSNLARLGPSVTVNGNLGRNEGNSFNQQEGRVVNGVVDFMSGSLNANMVLFNGMNRFNAYKQSQSQLESQIYTIERTNQDVIQLVSLQFLQCLLDQELLSIDKGNLEAQTKQLEQITAQVDAGSRAKVDVYNQEFQVKNAELAVLRSQIRLRNDKALLAQTLQIDAQSDFEVLEPSWDVNEISMSEMQLEELYNIAQKNRADYQRALADESAAKFGYQSQNGRYYPSITAFFSYGSQYNDVKGFNSRSFDQQFFEDNLQTTYGLSFNIPIFSGFQTRSATVQTRVNYENAKLDVENTETIVESDVLRAYQSYQDAITNYQASKSQLEAAQVSFNLEQERYKLGISDLVQFTQANQALVGAKADLAQSSYTLLFQDTLLQYAIGTLKFEDIP